MPCFRGGDHWLDVAVTQLAVVHLGPVGTVGEQPPWSSLRSSAATTDRRDLVDQADHLGDVVAVRGGHRGRQRDPAPVGDQMVLGARAATVNRGWPRLEPPKTARTWELSMTARDQSIRSV